MDTTFEDFIREDFIDGLIYFLEGKISRREALEICETHLHFEDFQDGSPLMHKGPRWLTKRVMISLKL